MTNPVDQNIPADGEGPRDDLTGLLKGGMMNVFTSVIEVQGYDLSGYRWFQVTSNRNVYEFDATSTAEHDGVLVIVDAVGNRFLKRDGVTVYSLANYAGDGVPSDALGSDGETYLDAATGNLYLKNAGSWGAPVFNIKGEEGQATLNVDGGYPDSVYGGTTPIDEGDLG